MLFIKTKSLSFTSQKIFILISNSSSVGKKDKFTVSSFLGLIEDSSSSPLTCRGSSPQLSTGLSPQHLADQYLPTEEDMVPPQPPHRPPLAPTA